MKDIQVRMKALVAGSRVRSQVSIDVYVPLASSCFRADTKRRALEPRVTFNTASCFPSCKKRIFKH